MRFWKDRNVFITGGTGLVGSWLTRFLVERGANTVLLVRDLLADSLVWEIPAPRRDKSPYPFTIVRGDLESFDLLERSLNEYEIDTVFHLGAQTIVGTANRNPRSTFESNVRGTWNVLEACRLVPTVKRIVVASSDKAYGEQEKLPYDESTPLQGKNPYDVSKSCADLVARSYFHSFGLPVCVTRCGNFYGPGDLNFNRIVPGTIRSVLRGEAPVIRSDGTFTRDYFYVKDGAFAYMDLAERMAPPTGTSAGEAFNFSNEQPMTVLDIVGRILRLMKSRLAPVILNQARQEIPHQYLSARKAREALGWRPRYSLDAGLRETIAWYTRLLAGGSGKRPAKS